MPATENHVLYGATNDTWRTWLMTGVRRAPVDRRRMRGANKGLKTMLLEGMTNGDDRPLQLPVIPPETVPVNIPTVPPVRVRVPRQV